MNYEIIFYRSGNTAKMQRLIENSLDGSGLRLKGADTARDKKELADILSPMLRRVRLIITVGGIGSAEDSPETVLCGLLVSKDKKKTEAEKLTAGKSTAYIIENMKQTIVCLPDEAENCRGLMDVLGKRLAESFGLEYKKSEEPDTEEIEKELDDQMAASTRVRVIPVTNTAEKRNKKRLANIKALMMLMIVLTVLQLGVAAYIFFYGMRFPF